jgi:hypothetical protein
MSVEISTNQHGANGIANGLVGLLDMTILMGTVSTSGPDGVAMSLEEGTDLLIVVEFTLLIQVNILTWNLGSILL